MTDREAFEKWASDSGLFPQAIERNGADQYILMTTSHGWLAWQAACKYKDEVRDAAATRSFSQLLYGNRRD